MKGKVALQPRRLSSLMVAIVACLTVVTACSGNDADRYLDNDTSREVMSLQQQWSELMQRPNIDEARVLHEKMQKEISETLGSQLGLAPWTKGTNASESPGCNDFHQVDAWDAVTQFLDNWATVDAISVNEWPQAVDTLKRIGGNYGFNVPGLEVNKGDYREVNLHDAYGAGLSLHSNSNPMGSLISVRTACHLLPVAKQRGGPTATAQPPSS